MRTVIFLGKRTAPGSPRALFPDADLWGVTHSNQKYARLGTVDDWTAWYDLHPVEPTPFYQGIRLLRPKTFAWYRTLPAGGRPVVLLAHDARIPASVAFPSQAIMDAFPILGEPGGWWSCQVDWMFAHALMLGYEHIVLAGHGVSEEPQHMIAHRGILYWVGFARGRGVQVTILPPSWYRAPAKAYGLAAGRWEPPAAWRIRR